MRDATVVTHEKRSDGASANSTTQKGDMDGRGVKVLIKFKK